jgi:hypothetical protein
MDWSSTRPCHRQTYSLDNKCHKPRVTARGSSPCSPCLQWLAQQENENNSPPMGGMVRHPPAAGDRPGVGCKQGKLSLNGTHPVRPLRRTSTPPVEGIFRRSLPCQPPWPSSSFPRKRESRHGQPGWHNKIMKISTTR